jgi:tetratricopeptide (TPR) repeat protein
MADACLQNKRYDQALQYLEQAKARLNEENSERFQAAEIYRLIGEAHRQANRDRDLAQRYFCEGLTVARQQKAKFLELRLCLSMCDLWDQSQNAERCRLQLREICGFFREGFDLPDLVKAKARLEGT